MHEEKQEQRKTDAIHSTYTPHTCIHEQWTMNRNTVRTKQLQEQEQETRSDKQTHTHPFQRICQCCTIRSPCNTNESTLGLWCVFGVLLWSNNTQNTQHRTQTSPITEHKRNDGRNEHQNQIWSTWVLVAATHPLHTPTNAKQEIGDVKKWEWSYALCVWLTGKGTWPHRTPNNFQYNPLLTAKHQMRSSTENENTEFAATTTRMQAISQTPNQQTQTDQTHENGQNLHLPIDGVLGSAITRNQSQMNSTQRT